MFELKNRLTVSWEDSATMVQGPSSSINFKSVRPPQPIRRGIILTSSMYRQGNWHRCELPAPDHAINLEITEARIHGSDVNISTVALDKKQTETHSRGVGSWRNFPAEPATRKPRSHGSDGVAPPPRPEAELAWRGSL